ncbi:MAG: hypothetical protein DMD76_11240 [Candidatus Rokuibacteriota bacterium]|nr:MAG: hypothetical protein DMD76_11240 [Candidatus Rokubacteria bacterium]
MGARRHRLRARPGRAAGAAALHHRRGGRPAGRRRRGQRERAGRRAHALSAVPASDLARERYLSLATFRKNGAEVRTPIWFAVIDDTLWMMTGGDTGKVKRLRGNPRARVAASDVRGIVHGPWREARARIAEDPREIAEARAMLRAKYGWQARLLDLFSRLSGRIHRRVWLAVALSKPGD